MASFTGTLFKLNEGKIFSVFLNNKDVDGPIGLFGSDSCSATVMKCFLGFSDRSSVLSC